MIKRKVTLPLYNDQMLLLTVLDVIRRSSFKQPPVYNDRRNVVPQMDVIHRFDCIAVFKSKKINFMKIFHEQYWIKNL